jgi:hypothetical protein
MVVSGDCLLLVWAVVPLILLTLAPVRNAHYVISAQVPWSVWAALALVRMGERLRRRGWNRATLIAAGRAGLATIALTYGLGFWLLGPWLDRRGVEWAFYEAAGRQVPAGMPFILLYDDWDRDPYDSPFGSIPHDLAVRLFYLHRSARWHDGPESLMAHDRVANRFPRAASRSAAEDSLMGLRGVPIAVIGRERDRPALERLGSVQIVARGPSLRRDRTYVLFRVTDGPIEVQAAR